MNQSKKIIVLLICLIAVCLHLCCRQLNAAESETQSEAQLLAKKYIEEYTQKEKFIIGKTLYQQMSADLEEIIEESSLSEHLLVRINEGMAKEESAKLVNSNISPLFSSLSNLSEQSTRDYERLMKRWNLVRSQANASEIEAFDLEQQLQVSGQLASLLNADNKWLWGCALLSIIGLVLAYSHTQRHKLRRLFWVKRSRYLFLIFAGCFLIAFTLIPTAILFLFGNQTYDALLAANSKTGQLPPRLQLQKDVEALQENIKNENLNVDYETSLKNAKSLLDEIQTKLESRVHETNQSLVTGWSDFKMKAIQLQVEHALYDRMQAEVDLENKRIKKTETQIKSFHEKNGDTKQTKYIYAAGMGLLMFCSFGFIAFFYTRQTFKQKKESEKTCPSCLNSGDNLHETQDNLGVSNLYCDANLTPLNDETCDFQFNSSYAAYPKFSFPILGVTSSGKTHWMAMVYRQLNHNQMPSSVNFERLKSTETQKFDRIVSELLDNRSGVQATRIGDRLPFPLTFLFRDNDQLGKSRLLVSLFDYGGEITTQETAWQRKRLLTADGYLFFLDPAKRSDEQVEALNLFREDVRSVLQIPEGRQIDRPVALCLSKLDLLPNQGFAMGGSFVDDFYNELQKVDTEHPEMTLSLLEKRSAMTEALLPAIFPGWDVLKTVRELFGPRALFFPMTPVGLQNPGEEDISKVTIDPYAILEPFIWLLHMNGYPILK